MESGQLMKTSNEPESKAVTLDDSTKSRLVAATGPSVLLTSSPLDTTATTLSGSKKTLKNVDLQELRSKAGLVAGALADFQAAGGLVVTKNIEYTLPSGETFSAVKIYLVAENSHLKVSKTVDGLDFDLVAEEQ